MQSPRRRYIVDFFFEIARLLKKGSVVTPHLYGGGGNDRIAWEYSRGKEFFDLVSRYKYLDNFADAEVLDVGCGWGGKLVSIAQNTKARKCVGIDLPGRYICDLSYAFARRRGVAKCSFYFGYAEKLPFKSESFDVVIMDDVLEHVALPKMALEECLRVLRLNGILIVKFPSFKMMYAHHLDRAISLPGIHCLLPLKVWAEGLNDLKIRKNLSYQFFDEIVSTPFHSGVTKNLNGITFNDFLEITPKNMQMEIIELLRHTPLRWKRRVYDLLYKLPGLQEFLSSSVFCIGRKIKVI